MKLTNIYDLWYAHMDWTSGHPVPRGVAFYVHNDEGQEWQLFRRILRGEYDGSLTEFDGPYRISVTRSNEASPRGAP